MSKLKIRGATVTAEPTKQFPSTDSPSPVPTPTTVDEDEEAALHRQLHKSAVVSHPLQSLPSRLESRTGSEVGGYSALTPQNTEIEVAALLSIITPDASVADSVDSDLVRLVKCLREGDGQARQAGVKALLALVEADPKRAHELRLPELFSVLAVMLRVRLGPFVHLIITPFYSRPCALTASSPSSTLNLHRTRTTIQWQRPSLGWWLQ